MITPLSFIFQSIPEAMVLTAFFLALIGYNMKDYVLKIVLSGIILASITVVLWKSELPFYARLIVQLPLFWLIFYGFFKYQFQKIMLAGTISFGILMILETISIELALIIFNKTIQDVLASDFLRSVTPSIGYLIMLSTAWFMNKYGYSLFKKSVVTLPNSSETKKVNLYIIILVFQIILVLIYNMSFVNGLFGQHELLFHMITFTMIAISIFLLFFVQNILSLTTKTAELEVHNEHLKNTNDLLITFQGQRHDFLNHIQVIYSYAKLGKHDLLVNYVNNIFFEVNELSKLKVPNNDTLSALLQTKSVILEANNIELKVNITGDISKTAIRPIELIKIVGNLIDNAKDAIHNHSAVTESQKKHEIILSIIEENDYIILSVMNTGSYIPEDTFNQIFETGFTTREKHTGIGLSIVQQILKKYNGKISVENVQSDGVIFNVRIPIIKS